MNEAATHFKWSGMMDGWLVIAWLASGFIGAYLIILANRHCWNETLDFSISPFNLTMMALGSTMGGALFFVAVVIWVIESITEIAERDTWFTRAFGKKEGGEP